jgi:CubicO group peptidase (beta-lactamase class C family)
MECVETRSALHTAVGTALDWPVPHVAAAVVLPDGTVAAETGEQERVFHLASLTKLLAAYAVLIAVEEGAVDWDDPAGPEGSTMRHLAAHTSGLSFSEGKAQAKPGARRIYSNSGFDVLDEAVAAAAGMSFADYLDEAVLTPLGMSSTSLEGSAAADAVSTCADLTRFAAELQAPTLVSPVTLQEATTVAFPGVDGVLPGFGRQKPNDWGLGFEIRNGKSPHWTGSANSGDTYGHFGQSGTFLWVDPQAELALVVLTDRNFGDWTYSRWPELSDGVLREFGAH